ncbi:MAG TPA: MBL fold metallo-hydrolase [Candidatus Limnocylindrales bacterium]|nr:MBL fold metallo-hydrolase [Candidatus Limnocylindrales bacterium]
MKVIFWGTRGSIAAAGPQTQGYGGNTACVEVTGSDGTCLVLDAGTGIRGLGSTLGPDVRRVDIFLSHLHMDHIQGLGFFAPLFRQDLEAHIWGPPSATQDLRSRLSRYLSPPLFPVRLRDLDSKVELHNAPDQPVRIGPFEVTSDEVIHPGPTVGFRITGDGATLAYLPDHEPALGMERFPGRPEWTSGHAIAEGADLLIHDAQYFAEERAERLGWGHTSTGEAAAFARQSGARRLACFHHDPAHDDATLDGLVAEVAAAAPDVEVSGAREGQTIDL